MKVLSSSCLGLVSRNCVLNIKNIMHINKNITNIMHHLQSEKIGETLWHYEDH